MNILHIRLAVALVGVLTWGYGARIGSQEVKWLGIAFLAVSLLLRFVRRKPEARSDDQ